MTLQQLKTYLSVPRRIAITTHQKPDGDAMGSSLGLAHYLQAKGHQITVVAPTDYPAFLKWLPGKQMVLIAPFQPEKAHRVFRNAEVIFCLDFNGLSRINEFGETVAAAKGFKVMIDHHTFPEKFADVSLWDEHASSTCELIYRLIAEEWRDKAALTQEIATCLYTGIMTDTGSFRFDNTTARVHRVIADLMETGIEAHLIHNNIYDTYTEMRLRLWGYCLLNCLKVLPHKKTAYFVIQRKVTLDFMMESGDLEGIVNYGLAMKGVLFSAIILEDEGLVKFSFRSKGSFGVVDFAKNFQGGGHFHAAGGRSLLSLEEAEQHFLAVLAETEVA